MGAQALNVGHEMPGRVSGELCKGRRLAGAALVEQHDAIHERIKVRAVKCGNAAAGTAVQHNDGLALRIAALLIVQLVQVVHFQTRALERLERGVQGATRVAALRDDWWKCHVVFAFDGERASGETAAREGMGNEGAQAASEHADLINVIMHA